MLGELEANSLGLGGLKRFAAKDHFRFPFSMLILSHSEIC